jgi:LysR family hydrogen peroxide-inducible transcriptional activator
LPSLAVSVENRRSQLDIRPFVKPVPGRTIALIWRPTSPLSDAFLAFAEMLRGEAKRKNVGLT